MKTIPGRPTEKQLAAYALEAVKREVADPYHGRLSSYSRDAAMVDVLNHFEGLTNSDDDRELIEDAVREAEFKVDENGL